MTDRDRVIERVLREGTARPSGETSGHCLDADTLAAWVDGRLLRAELAAAESHAAGCARCQAMLAVMARTSDTGEEAAAITVNPRRSFWRMLPWMGPVAAAATAAAIYVAVSPRIDVVPAPVQEAVAVRPNEGAPLPEPARPPQAVLEPVVPGPQGAPARVAEKDQDDRERSLRAADERRSADSAAKQAAKNAAPVDAPQDQITRRQTTKTQTTQTQATQTQATQTQAAQAQTGQLQKPGPVGGLSSSSTLPQAPPVAAERPATTAAPPPPPITAEELKRRESFQARGAATAPAGARADAFIDFAATPLVIQSPDLDIQWRVVAGNVVQRTTDRGRTWVTQATGTTKAIAAGFSTSATVCWLVGAGGLVVVTTDAKTWTPVAFPHAIDLTNVQASSADAAVVFAADGRTFTTADRGKSWK